MKQMLCFVLLFVMIILSTASSAQSVTFDSVRTEEEGDITKIIMISELINITIKEGRLQVGSLDTDGVKKKLCYSQVDEFTYDIVDLWMYGDQLRIGVFDFDEEYFILYCNTSSVNTNMETSDLGVSRELYSFVWEDREMAIVIWNGSSFVLSRGGETPDSEESVDLGDGLESTVGSLMFLTTDLGTYGFVYDSENDIIRQYNISSELLFLNQSAILNASGDATILRVVELENHGFVCFLVSEKTIKYWKVNSGSTGVVDIVSDQQFSLAGYNQVSGTQVFFYLTDYEDGTETHINLIFDVTDLSFTKIMIDDTDTFTSMFLTEASLLTGFEYSGFSNTGWKVLYNECGPYCNCTFKAPFTTICESCQEFYRLDNTSGCVAINECDENFMDTFVQCPDNSDCTNIESGGFQCVCFDTDLSQNINASCPIEMNYTYSLGATSLSISGTINIIAYLPSQALLIISDEGFIFLKYTVSRNGKWIEPVGESISTTNEIIVGYIIIDNYKVLLFQGNGRVNLYQTTSSNPGVYVRVSSATSTVSLPTGATFKSLQPANINDDGKIDFIATLARNDGLTTFARFVQTDVLYNFVKDETVPEVSVDFLPKLPFSVIDNQIVVATSTFVAVFDIAFTMIKQIPYPREIFDFEIGTSIIEKISTNKYLFSTDGNRIATLDISDESAPWYFSFLYKPENCEDKFGHTIGSVPSLHHPSINDIVYVGCENVWLLTLEPLYPICTEQCNGGTCEVTIMGENCYCEENYEFFEGDCLVLYCYDCLSAHQNTVCNNTDENFQCNCQEGYRGCVDSYECPDIDECTDIDECDENTNICGEDVCINTNGTYGCCPKGATCEWIDSELVVTGATSNVVVNGNAVLPNGFNFDIGSLTVSGSVNVTGGSVLVFTGTNELNATGCVNFEEGSSVQIDIDEETKKRLAKESEGLVLIRSSCISGIEGSVSECEDGVKETISIDEEIGMQVVYGQCIDSTTMSIIVVAACVVILLVLGFLLLVMFTPLKRKILPNRNRRSVS